MARARTAVNNEMSWDFHGMINSINFFSKNSKSEYNMWEDIRIRLTQIVWQDACEAPALLPTFASQLHDVSLLCLFSKIISFCAA